MTLYAVRKPIETICMDWSTCQSIVSGVSGAQYRKFDSLDAAKAWIEKKEDDSKKNVTKSILVYADGACSGNPGPGGWAALIKYDNTQESLSGSCRQATNGRMEIMAALEGAKKATQMFPGKAVRILSDSSYVVKALNDWMDRWKSNDWHGSSGAVKHQDLWKEFDRLKRNHRISASWVKGHASDPDNNYVDKLAREASLAA